MSSASDRAAELAARARAAAPELTPQQVLSSLKRLDMNLQTLARDPRGVDMAAKAIRGVLPLPVRMAVRERRIRSVVEVALALYAQRGEAAITDSDASESSVATIGASDAEAAAEPPTSEAASTTAATPPAGAESQFGAPRDFRGHFLGVLQDELDRRWAREMQVSHDKLERAREAPYQHSAAVDHEMARVRKCQQAIQLIERAKEDVRAMQGSSYEEFKAFTDDRMIHAMDILYPRQ